MRKPEKKKKKKRKKKKRERGLLCKKEKDEEGSLVEILSLSVLFCVQWCIVHNRHGMMR